MLERCMVADPVRPGPQELVVLLGLVAAVAGPLLVVPAFTVVTVARHLPDRYRVVVDPLVDLLAQEVNCVYGFRNIE